MDAVIIRFELHDFAIKLVEVVAIVLFQFFWRSPIVFIYEEFTNA